VNAALKEEKELYFSETLNLFVLYRKRRIELSSRNRRGREKGSRRASTICCWGAAFSHGIVRFRGKKKSTHLIAKKGGKGP